MEWLPKKLGDFLETFRQRAPNLFISDVNKDWTCKDKDNDKDQAYKDQDKDKD